MVKLSGEFILRIKGRLIWAPYSENALPLGLYITRSKLEPLQNEDCNRKVLNPVPAGGFRF
jgi:hypothetical protein